MTTSHSSPAALVQLRVLPLRLKRPGALGFTLIELLMVLAVMGVILSFVVPWFSSVIGSTRLTAASNTLLSSLHLARSEAIKRNGRVMLCKSADGAACSMAGGWEQGWIVFHDVNSNGERDREEGMIERGPPLTSLRLTGNSPVGRYVSYIATGTAKLVGGGFQAGTLTICDQTGTSREARQIILSAVGRPRVLKVNATSCT